MRSLVHNAALLSTGDEFLAWTASQDLRGALPVSKCEDCGEDAVVVIWHGVGGLGRLFCALHSMMPYTCGGNL